MKRSAALITALFILLPLCVPAQDAPAAAEPESSPEAPQQGSGANELVFMPRSSFTAEGEETGTVTGFGLVSGYNRWLSETFALGFRGGVSLVQAQNRLLLTDAEVIGLLSLALGGGLDWARITLQAGHSLAGVPTVIAGFGVGAALAVSPALNLQVELGFRSVPGRVPDVEQVGAVGIGFRFGPRVSGAAPAQSGAEAGSSDSE